MFTAREWNSWEFRKISPKNTHFVTLPINSYNSRWGVLCELGWAQNVKSWKISEYFVESLFYINKIQSIACKNTNLCWIFWYFWLNYVMLDLCWVDFVCWVTAEITPNTLNYCWVFRSLSLLGLCPLSMLSLSIYWVSDSLNLLSLWFFV